MGLFSHGNVNTWCVIFQLEYISRMYMVMTTYGNHEWNLTTYGNHEATEI